MLRVGDDVSDENVTHEKPSFKQLVSQQFWKYIMKNNVLEILQPSLSLLYEMPIKSTNIYEFLAEFLENGAQDLLKISLLQAELCYKQNELTQLQQYFLKSQSPTSPVSTTLKQKLLSNNTAVEFFQTPSSVQTCRKDSLTSLICESGTALDYISIQDDAQYIEAMLRSRRLSGMTDYFMLEDVAVDEPTPSTIETEGIQYKKDKRSPKTRKAKVIESSNDGVKKSTKKSKVNKVLEVQPKKKDTGKKVKGKRTRDKLEDDTGRQTVVVPEELKEMIDEETQISSHALNPPDSDNVNQSPTTAQSRRIAKLVAGINNPDERLAMENTLMMISDHRKIDPWGVLFDFNRRNIERKYELELFDNSATKEFLRPVTHKSMKSKEERSNVVVEKEQQGNDSKIDIMPGSDKESTEAHGEGDHERMTTIDEQEPITKQGSEELPICPTKQSNFHQIRDGLNFLYNFKKKEIMAMKKREQLERQKSTSLLDTCTNCSADSLLESFAEEDSGKRSEQLLRMFVESYGDSKTLQKCESFKQHEKHASITHGVNDVNMLPFDEATDKQSVGDMATFITPYQPSTKRRTRKKLRIMFENLMNMYRKYLKLLNSTEQPDMSIVDLSQTIERKEMMQRLEIFLLQKRDVTLSAIKPYLLSTLQKERQIRLKAFNRKFRKHKNFGYTKVKPFEETKRKEALHDTYSIAAPTISAKEIQRFVERFDSHKNFNSEGLRTKTDFLYDFPLSDVKATQRWIDNTFQESVWRLNEPLGNPQDDHDFDDDDDDNYIWVEDYDNDNISTSAKMSIQDDAENTAIPLSDLKKIQQFLQVTQSECCPDGTETVAPRAATGLLQGEEICKVEVIEEKNLPQGIPLVTSESLASLLKTRPLRKPYAALRPSERARHYVQKAFNSETKESILNNFPFEIFDED